jgi:hypothetical protein
VHHQTAIRKTTTFQKDQNLVILETFTPVGEARYLYSFSNMKKNSVGTIPIRLFKSYGMLNKDKTHISEEYCLIQNAAYRYLQSLD